MNYHHFMNNFEYIVLFYFILKESMSIIDLKSAMMLSSLWYFIYI